MLLIQKTLFKYRLEILIAFVLVALYFILRLYNIMSLPIFTDEAIYVRWSQIAKQDASWRFISLTDGKQPMFVWIAMIMMRFIEDPLLASRLVSVSGGFFTMIGLFLLGNELFKNKWAGFISSFLYIIYPFALVYDRMALYDSLVGTFAVWSLYFEVLLVRRLRLDFALILSMVLGGGILTKTSGFFSIYLVPFLLLIFDWKKKDKHLKFLILAALITLSIALAYAYYSILRLSPFFYIINEKNALFVFPLSEWLKHPFLYFLSNLSGLWDWFITYMTWPVFLLVVLSFLISKKFLREKVLLLAWFIVPFFALVLFGKTIYPRFIFFMTLSLIPLAAFSIFEITEKLKNKFIAIIVVSSLLLLFIRSDWLIINDFKNAPIPVVDLDQYINGWPAGGGINEAIQFFDSEASSKKIFIGTEGTFGLMPFSIEIYLKNNPNITIFGFWPVGDKPPAEIIKASKAMDTYVIFYQPCPSCSHNGGAPVSWPLVLISQVKKGSSNYFSVYKVKP
ncbi:MAG: glycosyltransferase family 39 protein [Patescibacteria group bacterium]